jgi:hypothetical protein
MVMMERDGATVEGFDGHPTRPELLRRAQDGALKERRRRLAAMPRTWILLSLIMAGSVG